MSQSYARRQRRIAEATERQSKRGGKLDAYNETVKGGTFHPTKGFRRISARRQAASAITQMTLEGFGMSTAEMREALNHHAAEAA